MARGTYYKCNVCGHTEFSEIGGDIHSEHVQEAVIDSIKSLPRGWFELRSASMHYVLHVCSLECANAVLEDVENDKDKAEEEV